MQLSELQLVAVSPPRRDPHTRTDASIIARSRHDPHAFEELYDRYWPALHAFCCARAGEAGEDLAAETFRVAFDKRRRYQTAYEDARPWLYGIAVKLLQRHFRDRRRRDGALTRAGALAHRPPGGGADGALEHQLLGPQLTAALAGLTSDEREALLLWAWGDLQYAEIALALDVPLGTVRSRLHRARRRVRDHLTERNAS
jgi:RNA polymerase sigma factor (sigma-70 family)